MSFVSSHNNATFGWNPLSTCKPAFSVGFDNWSMSEFRVSILSPIFNWFVSIYVTSPLIIKLPVIFTSPEIVPPAEANLVFACV